MCKICHIVPKDVLVRFSEDTSLSDSIRVGLANTASIDVAIRKMRIQAGELTRVAGVAPQLMVQLAASPAITMYDCRHAQTLPGVSVPSPSSSLDQTVKRAAATTAKVAEFYQKVFGRNSVDGAGMTMMSSVHFGNRYNNAFWNGGQMAYGDGDGSLFIDFTNSNDVIGHELTHGVTQYSLRLGYSNEAGGLNESLSDVFGSMFRQWLANQSVTAADWLIGKEIIGPTAHGRGFTCLRDMARPGATHCLAPQPDHFSKYRAGMDPHYSSGIPNLAFFYAAQAIGGKSWDKCGQIWYRSMTGFGASPSMKMLKFANRTRKVAAKLYPGESHVIAAVDKAWQQVGL